jgi:uncharacterized membrane protein YeaQ/YmgE (transglycosylase-associated protein family)
VFQFRVGHRPKRYYVSVFPISPVVVILYLMAYAVAGMAIGTLSGWLCSLMTKSGTQGILKDAFLGSFGYLAGFIGCIFMPWPRNTVVERLQGGGSVATTMNAYQHPERVAIVVAVLLPLLHELYRFKRTRSRLT